MSCIKPALFVFGGLGSIVLIFFGGLMLWAWKEQRDWIVSQAIDRGACSKTDHHYLQAPTPRASRELFAADAACRAQIIHMLSAAPNFTCVGDERLTVCLHPLNAADSTTYVRAILTQSHVLLETIPT